MKNARHNYKIASALALICLSAAVFSPSEVTAAAGGVQNCTTGATCTIGEFLYDDNSAPIAGAACTITSKKPDLTSFLSSQTMSGGGADGWYYHSFTAPATLGMYPTQVSCTVSSDTLSIDKSFQVNDVVSGGSVDSNAIASAVWNYSGRTISSFGTLIADVWSNATRTLTDSSGGTTNVTNVTNVTNTTDNAVVGTINSIKKTTDATRLLLEQVVNKPIIQNVLQDTSPPLTDKLNGTRAMANQIYVNNQFLTAQSATLASTWNNTDGKTLLANVIALSNVLGTSADLSSANTMFGTANWLKDSWNWDESGSLYNQLVSTDKIISDLEAGLANYQKSPALFAEAKQLVKNSLALEKIVGSTTDKGTEGTLYARIGNTQALASNLDDKSTEVNKVLGDYVKSNDAVSAVSQITDLQNQVIALNKVPGAGNALAKINPNDGNSIKNVLLGLGGIINSNKMLLSLGAGKTLTNTWLEVGSIIFKTLATNPSTLISQNVEVKYYLPQEIKKEDIVKTDPGLTVNYDADKNQLYVDGTFNLAPGATRTFSVETKDIWSYSPEVINGLKKQASDLFQPLVKTAFYAQGVSLQSDINANLDQMSALQAAAMTPEEKIIAYRQCVVLEKSVQDKLTGMKNLVTQASSAGSLFGFVGGSQTIAVWGLIIVIAAGFVFMTIYMRTITAKAKAENLAEAVESKLDQVLVPTKKQHIHSAKVHPLGLVAIMLVTSTLSAAASGYVVNTVVSKNYQAKLEVLGTETSAPAVVSTPAPTPSAIGTGTGGQYLVVVGDTPTGFLNVRKTVSGEVIAKVMPGDKLPFVDEQNGWYKVTLEDGTVGWISKQFSSKE